MTGPILLRDRVGTAVEGENLVDLNRGFEAGDRYDAEPFFKAYFSPPASFGPL